ncbi:MAG: hypothetical protein HY957_00260 [Nitrospirae bacterium]|nr:hypothetical protein [Nitrospirota bacterium]
MRILDTSVIYKWYIEEANTAKALLLRDDFVRRGVENNKQRIPCQKLLD